MRIKTSRLKTLSTLFGAGYDYIDIEAAEGGWEAYAMSADLVTLMSARVPRDAFEEYAPQGRFEVAVKDLSDAIKHMGETTDVDLADGGARLVLASGGMSIKVPLPPAPTEERRRPKLPFSSGFVCDMDPIRKVVDASRSGIVRFRTSAEGLEVESLDEAGCGPKWTIPAADMPSIEGEASSGYGTAYVQQFAAKFPKGSLASVEFGSSFPMAMSYAIDMVEGTYIIAPIQEEARR